MVAVLLALRRVPVRVSQRLHYRFLRTFCRCICQMRNLVAIFTLRRRSSERNTATHQRQAHPGRPPAILRLSFQQLARRGGSGFNFIEERFEAGRFGRLLVDGLGLENPSRQNGHVHWSARRESS